jgi:putative NADH-flavin reductase
MRIALFGVSGRTGQAIVRLAQRRWVEVTGLARPQARVAAAVNLTLLRGDLTDNRAVLATLDGAEAACIVFGPRPPYRDVFCADATTRIIKAMQSTRMPRLICQTSALVGELPGSMSPFLRLKARSFATIHPAVAADLALQEDAVRFSGLQWTLVKPGQLTQKPFPAKVRAGTGIRLGLFSGISREGVAEFVLDELQRSRFVRKVVYLAGG